MTVCLNFWKGTVHMQADYFIKTLVTTRHLGNGHFPPSLSSSVYLERTSLQRPSRESIASCETFASEK